MHIMTIQTMSGKKVYLGYYIRKKFNSPPMYQFNFCLSRNVTWCDLGNRPFLLLCLFFWNIIIPRFSRPAFEKDFGYFPWCGDWEVNGAHKMDVICSDRCLPQLLLYVHVLLLF